MADFINSRPVEFIEILVSIWAGLMGGRNVAEYDYLVQLNPPKWLRRALFLPARKLISLEGIIFQIATLLLGFGALLNWFGVNIFAPFGEFKLGFSYVVFPLLCLFLLDAIIQIIFFKRLR